MNPVAADVSPLTYLRGSLSRLTSAATNANWFIVPMHAQKRKGALHEPCSSGRESAHLSLGKFEPTHVGCYEREAKQFIVPRHVPKRKGISHEPMLVWSPAFRRPGATAVGPHEQLGPAGTPNRPRSMIPTQVKKERWLS